MSHRSRQFPDFPLPVQQVLSSCSMTCCSPLSSYRPLPSSSWLDNDVYNIRSQIFQKQIECLLNCQQSNILSKKLNVKKTSECPSMTEGFGCCNVNPTETGLLRTNEIQMTSQQLHRHLFRHGWPYATREMLLRTNTWSAWSLPLELRLWLMNTRSLLF